MTRKGDVSFWIALRSIFFVGEKYAFTSLAGGEDVYVRRGGLSSVREPTILHRGGVLRSWLGI